MSGAAPPGAELGRRGEWPLRDRIPLVMCEGEVVHVGHGLDSVVEAVASPPAVAEDLEVLHPADDVGAKLPSRSRGTAVSTGPTTISTVSTVLARVPFRELPPFLPAGSCLS